MSETTVIQPTPPNVMPSNETQQINTTSAFFSETGLMTNDAKPSCMFSLALQPTIESYYDYFNISINDNENFERIYKLFDDDFITKSHYRTFVARYYRNFTYDCYVRLRVALPPQVQGKLKIEFVPKWDIEPTLGKDIRSTMFVEWNLADSDFFELKLPNVHPFDFRRLRRPLTNAPSPMVVPVPIGDEYYDENIGTLKISVLQPLQVGSLFPDSYRFIVTLMFNNIKGYNPLTTPIRWN